jgi:hypothetical protein
MTTDVGTAIAADLLLPAFFLVATFTTGPVYLWTGNYPIVWNSHTWLGVGTLGGISVIEEGSDVQAKGITLTLSGFDATLLPDVLTEFQLGAPVTVYVGFFNPISLALITSPIIAWAGRMDQPTIDVDGKSAAIGINCESRLIDLNTPVDRRYTQDDQQLVAPGDLGFSFQAGIQEVTIYWGESPNSKNNI